MTPRDNSHSFDAHALAEKTVEFFPIGMEGELLRDCVFRIESLLTEAMEEALRKQDAAVKEWSRLGIIKIVKEAKAAAYEECAKIAGDMGHMTNGLKDLRSWTAYELAKALRQRAKEIK